jgi:hypothetical protein
MHPWLQTALVFAIVALAAGYLVSCFWRSLRAWRSGQCGGCHGCGSSKAPAVVTLEPLAAKSDRP